MTNGSRDGRAGRPVAGAPTIRPPGEGVVRPRAACPRSRSGACGVLLLALFSPIALADTQFIPDRPWDVTHLKVALNVDLESRHVTGDATIQLTATRPATRIEFDAVELKIRGVQYRRGPAPPVDVAYAVQEGRLDLEIPPPTVAAGEPLTVLVQYEVDKPSRGLHFFSPTEGDPEVPLQVWSQGQSNYTRHWIPCFDDPSELQTTELIVTTARGYQVVSNGKLVSQSYETDGRVTFHWLQDQPHPSYLITLVVGKFAVIQDVWRGKPVTYYVPPGRESQVKNAFGRTPEMLDYFSAKTGVEYPWDKYAQICAYQFGGGMENTSATTLGEDVLHDDRAHLDADVDDLIAHELAHQWFGNLVTCRSWSHVWLNEGFATFFEAVWAERTEGRDGYQSVLHHCREVALAGGGKAPIVDRDYRHADRMFDARVYQKAGFMLHALKARVGEDVFWRAVQRYLTRYRHQAVETHEFRRVMEAEYGGSLERFFYDWTERAGHPVINVAYRWSGEENAVILTVRQKTEGEPFEMPLEVEVQVGDGPPQRTTHWLRNAEHEFRIPLAAEPARVSFDPEQVVLGELKVDLPRPLYAAELRSGPSLSGRIRALEALSREPTEADIALMNDLLRGEPHPTLARALTARLSKADTPAAREGLLAAATARNPRIRRAAVDALGKVTGDARLLDQLRRIIDAGDPSYRVEAAAIKAYAAHKPEGASEYLSTLMSRESHDDIIRDAVLSALTDVADGKTLDVFLEWSDRGKAATLRREAIRALGRYCEKEDCPAADKTRVAKHLARFLDGESDRLLGDVLSTLGRIGKPARGVLPRLKEIAEQSTSDRVKRDAKRAIEQIEANPRKEKRKSEKAEKKDKKKDQKKKKDKKGKADPNLKKAPVATEPASVRSRRAAGLRATPVRRTGRAGQA